MQPKATRSDVFRRANELARANRKTVNSSIRIGFGTWLRMAWAEAKTGTTHNWIWLCVENKLAWLKNQRDTAYANSFSSAFDQRSCHAEMVRLSAEIRELEASIAPVEFKVAA